MADEGERADSRPRDRSAHAGNGIAAIDRAIRFEAIVALAVGRGIGARGRMRDDAGHRAGLAERPDRDLGHPPRWEDANRDKIVAIKSLAEALTIADRLPEAHAKYRELEAIVAGRQIRTPG